VRQRLTDAYLPGYQKNLMVWPWVQFANFKYVPADFRVLVVNFVSLGELIPILMHAWTLVASCNRSLLIRLCSLLGWNCYLSYLNSGGGTKPNLPKGHTKEGGALPPM